MNLRTLIREFQNPPAPYRGKPFWAWNGKLEHQELRRQVQITHRMGFGGFFMHARVGLATPYLSDEWFRCVETCIDEAKRLGLEAWLYDEDRWPSGFAGGLVTRDPANRQRMLEMSVGGTKKANRREALALFAATIRDEHIEACRRIGPEESLEESETILAFTPRIQSPTDWYGGGAYLDTLNPEAVRAFIRVTHDAYAARVREHFGTTVPGIFTDEPVFGKMFTRLGEKPTIPWTERLPQVFRELSGYGLIDRLPEIFYPRQGETISKVRYDYFRCITQMFVDAFAKQLGSWCNDNGILLTGHVDAEESLQTQARVVGSAMRFYEHMQAPGMDLLTQHNREYITAKQVSSVARQFARTWRLTETYGCTGWDFPFLGHKAVGDWQVALGMNLRCHHLAMYTMEGEAKRDYPASIFYQSPWWEHYPCVEDYFARIHAIMTRGREVRDVLVVHPVESAWAMYHYRAEPLIHAYQVEFVRLCDQLLMDHIDFDYGDEDILARHGWVGSAEGDGAAAIGVNEAAYRIVVVPPLKTIRSTTLDLLERFARAGGPVVWIGPPPSHVDALASEQAAKVAASCHSVEAIDASLVSLLERWGRRVSILDTEGKEVPAALYILREDAQACYLFLCNTGHLLTPENARKRQEEGTSARTLAYDNVRVVAFDGCEGDPLECDPETGDIRIARAQRSGKSWVISTDLPRLESRLYVCPKQPQAWPFPRVQRWTVARNQPIDRDRWDISLSDHNVLVLDTPSYQIGGRKCIEPREVLKIDREVRSGLRLPLRGGRMLQPWARRKRGSAASVPVLLKHVFTVEQVPTGDLFLATEVPDRYRIWINDLLVDTSRAAVWWTDLSCRTLSLDPSVLRSGENSIVMATEYCEDHPGLEAIFLLGHFGARVNGKAVTLVECPSTLAPGDWTEQGLPFFGGSVTYRTRVSIVRSGDERVYVSVPDFRGTAVRILVDGRPAGIRGWDPFEVDLSDFCRGNESQEIGIEIVGHRRNSHGPLHNVDRSPKWTGPGQFVTAGRDWCDAYVLLPCGLMAAPQILYKRQVD